jgi:tRNA uridine 5-carboxymethylaminomethyl modification enzyme
VNRLRAYENTLIPDDFDYAQVEGLSNEVKQKLTAARPQTLARASRISGITPAAISLVLVYLKKRGVLQRLKEDAPAQQAS